MAKMKARGPQGANLKEEAELMAKEPEMEDYSQYLIMAMSNIEENKMRDFRMAMNFNLNTLTIMLGALVHDLVSTKVEDMNDKDQIVEELNKVAEVFSASLMIGGDMLMDEGNNHGE